MRYILFDEDGDIRLIWMAIGVGVLAISILMFLFYLTGVIVEESRKQDDWYAKHCKLVEEISGTPTYGIVNGEYAFLNQDDKKVYECDDGVKRTR